MLGVTWVGSREEPEEEVRGGRGGAKVCVGVGVERCRRVPESGRKLFRGFSA